MAKRVTDKKRPNGAWDQQRARAEIIKKSYNDINKNYSKYSVENRLRIALVILSKDMTQKVEHSGTVSFADLIKKAG